MSIFIVVLIYEIVSIGGASLYIHHKNKQKAQHTIGGDSFVTADRSLGTVLLGVSIALGVLGAVHIFGIMEVSWGLGAISIWFSISHVILLCVICLATGRWVRRLKVGTVPELIRSIFGNRIALVTTCVLAGQTFAILTMEVQALGIVFHTLTRGAVSIQVGAILGCIIGVAYVAFAGMKEIALVNLINTIVMYVGIILATIFLSGVLPGGWYAVESHFASHDMSYMTNIFGNGSIFMAFGLTTVIAVVFAQSISQMGLQTAMAAKNEKTIKRALWIAAPINGIFGIFTMAMGLAARSLVERGELQVPMEVAPKVAGVEMLMKYMPDWLVGWLLAAFLGAIVSTFALTTMGLGALFARNVYTLKNPNMTGKQETRIIRIIIVLAGILACAVSSFMPAIINGANWVFAWLAPIFWAVIFGLFWKRSSTAAGVMLGTAWIAIMIWTYTPLPFALGLQGIPVPYLSLGISLIVGIIVTAILPGQTALFKSGVKVAEGR